MSDTAPKFSVCEFTTPSLTFEQDLALYAALGVRGISICEVKLREGAEREQLAAFHESGLEATVCIPVNLGVLESGPLFPGPRDLRARQEAMVRSIERLAPFRPEGLVVITGSGREHSEADARRFAVDGLRVAARRAGELDLRLSIEPLRTDGGLDISLVQTVEETLQLIDDVGEPNVDIAYDVYHLWDAPNAVELAFAHAGSVGGVHVCDWREPPRSVGDRLLPGDGPIDLPALFGALDAGGYTGWYDLEIFSDLALPDSLWKLDPQELVERGRDGFLTAWDKRLAPSERQPT